ncbi:MAG: hypothetical protein ACOYXB_09740 [Bacteroidota bacterium]
MKKYMYAVLFFLFAVATSDVFAGSWCNPGGPGSGSGGGATGAPLDGGLLAILGAAGVTYLVSRRKKNKE